MPSLTKLVFTVLMLPWLCQCMVQTNPYFLSANQTLYAHGFFPVLQVEDLQLFTNDYQLKLNTDTIATYNLTNGQISAFPGDSNCSSEIIINGNAIYCLNSDYHVVQLDPLNSMAQIADYGAPNLTEPHLDDYDDGGIVFAAGYGGPYEIFNTNINQFTCQFSTEPNAIFPYAGGYVASDGTDGSDAQDFQRYFSCNGTVLFDYGEVGMVQFLLNSSSVIITLYDITTAFALSTSQTGPALALSQNLGTIMKVNDTHFFVTLWDGEPGVLTTMTLYTTNSDLEIILSASLDLQNIGISATGYRIVFHGNNSVIFSYTSDGKTLFWIDLESLTISQISPVGNTSYPQMMLSNGSRLGFTQDGYYIFSADAVVTFDSYISYYIDPSNTDFVWILLDSNATVLMIQISTSISETFPLHLTSDQGWTLVSASFDGVDEYNFTLLNSTYPQSVVVLISGIPLATISVDGYQNIIATNYQEGNLYSLSTSMFGIYQEVYDLYNGSKVKDSTIMKGSSTNMAKINDDYAIITNSTTSASSDIYVYSFSESQFIYSQSFPVQAIDQIVPLGINLTTYCIAQGFAILSGDYQTYSAFDTEGNQLDSIIFPSDYTAQLQAINNISVSLMVTTSSTNPFNYLSVYEYTGTVPNPHPNPPNPNPQGSPQISLSHIPLVILMIGSLII